MRELASVKRFAKEAPELYTAFKDYSDHKMAVERNIQGKTFVNKSFEQKEDVINKLFAKEVEERSKISLSDFDGDVAHYAQHPSVKAFADAIVDRMIDMILPDMLNSSIGMIAEIQYLDWGDSGKFNLENNALFNVAKAGYRQRNTLYQKLEDTTVTLAPVAHEVSVITNLYNVLSGRDSIAKYVMKAAKSIEAEMLNETWSAFNTAVTASTTPSALKVTNYAENSAITLAEKVTAWNGGKKAIFAGTPVALKALLPSNTNYRYMLDDAMVKLGYIPTFNNYDVLPVPQIADYTSTEYGLLLDDTKIYVVSPASDKIIKVVVGGTLSNTDGTYANANLAVGGTITKSWEVGAITNSIAGYIGTSGD